DLFPTRNVCVWLTNRHGWDINYVERFIGMQSVRGVENIFPQVTPMTDLSAAIRQGHLMGVPHQDLLRQRNVRRWFPREHQKLKRLVRDIRYAMPKFWGN